MEPEIEIEIESLDGNQALSSRFKNGVIPPPPSVPPPAYLLEGQGEIEEQIYLEQTKETIRRREKAKKEVDENKGNTEKEQKEIKGIIKTSKILPREEKVERSKECKESRIQDQQQHQKKKEKVKGNTKWREGEEEQEEEDTKSSLSTSAASLSEFTEPFTESEAGYSDLIQASSTDVQTREGSQSINSSTDLKETEKDKKKLSVGRHYDDNNSIEEKRKQEEMKYLHRQASKGGKHRTYEAFIATSGKGKSNNNSTKKKKNYGSNNKEKDKDKDLEDENILVDDALYQQLKGIFAAIDNDVDGYLTRPQISLALQFVGIIPTNENLNYILFGQEDGDEEGTGVEKEQNITKEGEGVKGSKTKREKLKGGKNKKSNKNAPMNSINGKHFISRVALLINREGLVPGLLPSPNSTTTKERSNAKDTQHEISSPFLSSSSPSNFLVDNYILEFFSAMDTKGKQGKISLQELRHIMTEVMIPEAFSRNEFEEFLDYAKLYITSSSVQAEGKRKKKAVGKENENEKEIEKQVRLFERQAEEEAIMVDYVALMKNLAAGKPILSCL